MSFTVRIDPDLCMGAQRCMFLAPEVFDLNEDGIAMVLDASGLSEERAEKLAYECPNMAIEVNQQD